jgi:hypothetical protein
MNGIEALSACKTSPAVAKLLRGEMDRNGVNLKGERMNPCGCPIAKYLTYRNEGTTVNVITSAAYFTPPTSSEHATYVKLPTPVSDFIRSFDKGRYPDLVIS